LFTFEKIIDALQAPSLQDASFLTKIGNQLVEYICTDSSHEYLLRSGTELKRARNGVEKYRSSDAVNLFETEIVPVPWEKEKIGANSREKTLAGRFNRDCERVLYLSNSIPIALSEVRAISDQHVSVGTFSTQKDLNLLNLVDVPKPKGRGILTTDEDFETTYRRIALHAQTQFPSEEAKRNYRLTQFVASVAAEAKLDGIMYRTAFFESVWNEASQETDLADCNIVLFNPENVDFVKSEVAIIQRERPKALSIKTL